MANSPSAARLFPLGDDELDGRLRVVPFEVPGLGNRTYIAGGDGYAFVVDPPRDADSLLGFAADHGWVITHVIETHIHNDYVSGGYEVARRTDAEYIVPAQSALLCAAREVADGDQFEVGCETVRAVRTPGHTPTSTSYVLAIDNADVAVFTGGGLLYNGVGRTDLFGADRADELARAQWHSAHRLSALSPATTVLPTHGFGSFCSVGESGFTERTVAGLQRTNQVFLEDEDVFVQRLLASQGPYPSYFNEMAAINRQGTRDHSMPAPQMVPLVELATRAANGEWVLDLRHRHDFARSHIPGSISFDSSGAYVSYIGWLLPWQSPIHLIAADQGVLDTAIGELARIGIESVESAAFWGDGSLSSDQLLSGEYADARRLRGALDDDRELRVLDVRLPAECVRGTIAGELAIPVHELLDRMDEIARWSGGREVWVYCASGFRAAVAASMLARAGMPAVAVDGSVVDS